MNRALPAFAVVLLFAGGCQPPAPVTSPVPSVPVAVVVPSPPLAAPPAFQSPAAPMPPMQDATAATVTFLQTLGRTLEAKRGIDRDANERNQQTQASVHQQRVQDMGDSPQAGRAVIVASADAFTQTTQEQERQTTNLLARLTQTPAPPDTQNLLRMYRDLLQTQAIQNRRLSDESQFNARHPESVTPDTANVILERAGQEQAERTRQVQAINAEIERVRNSAPAIAAQVPPFGITE